MRQKAWRYEWLVDCDCCCCLGGPRLQFGTAAIWGIIPVVGDLVSLYNAASLVRAARGVRGGLPPGVLGAMAAWALVDFVIKLVPVVGDVLTAIIKPNTRNCMMVSSRPLSLEWLILGVVQPTDGGLSTNGDSI